MKKKTIQKIGFDPETLKRWKKSSVKAKLIWLESALYFGKQKKSDNVQPGEPRCGTKI